MSTTFDSAIAVGVTGISSAVLLSVTVDVNLDTLVSLRI